MLHLAGLCTIALSTSLAGKTLHCFAQASRGSADLLKHGPLCLLAVLLLTGLAQMAKVTQVATATALWLPHKGAGSASAKVMPCGAERGQLREHVRQLEDHWAQRWS
mmetsp:Transcript_20630/g.45195  ORF Transcript_20630/g.45195 Transcript_20630/m.45195 type:complete len:107 (-) Transcript_20630:259-579(-)